jgi:hypothetical protein
MTYMIAIVFGLTVVAIWRAWVKYQERQQLLSIIDGKNKTIEYLEMQRKTLSELRELKRHGTTEEGNLSFFDVMRRVLAVA